MPYDAVEFLLLTLTFFKKISPLSTPFLIFTPKFSEANNLERKKLPNLHANVVQIQLEMDNVVS